MQINNETIKISSNKVNITYRWLFISAILYLAVPIAIFWAFWMKALIAIPLIVALAFVVCYSIRDFNKNNQREVLTETKLEVSYKYLIALIAISILIAIVIGIGEYVFSTDDHAFRRAMLRDLINYKWPIYFDLSKISNPEVNAIFPDRTVAFAYYLTFWMIPALFGKVFGFAVGNFVLLLWSSFGLFLILIGMSMICKRQTFAPVFALILFSGLDIIPYLYYDSRIKEEWMWLEGYTQHIVFISNINNLMNVFNQCIPCYLIVVLLLLMKNTRSTGLIAGMCFAYSPWATIGILPIAVYELFAKRFKSSNSKVSFKNVFSVGNVLSAIVLFIGFGPMYMANSTATSISGTTLSFYGSFSKFAVGYLLVFLVEILPSIILFGKKNFKDGLFITTIITLLILPFYKISYQNDLTMRGSMPALFVLTIYMAVMLSDFVFENSGKNSKELHLSIGLIAKTLIILVMSMVALQMFLVHGSLQISGEKTNDDVYSIGDVKTVDKAYVVGGNFYVYEYKDTFFYSKMVRTIGE